MVAGALAAAYQLGAVFVTRFGITWIDAHEQAHGGRLFGAPVYWWAAVLQVGLVMGLAFFLWEEKPDAGIVRPRLTVVRYARDFVEQAGLLRLGCINFLRAFMVNAATGFMVLFGTVTLGASMTDYSRMMGWLPLLGLVYVWVIGAIADRLRRNVVLMVAFGGCVAGYTVAWQAQTLLVLAAAAVMFQFSFSAVDITYKSLVTDFYPRQMVGQLAGAINIFYATGRTLALVSVGAIVGALDDDYRISWLIAIAAGIACILVMLTISDPRNGRRTGPAA